MKIFSEYSAKLSPHKEFDPKAFIEGENASQELCSFVLTLALAYNDFRFYNMVFLMVTESKPLGTQQRNPAWGEYAGFRLHIFRLTVGFVHELFRLIQDNRKLLDDPFLKEVIRCLNKKARGSWTGLVEAALVDSTTPRRSNPFFMIRNKLIFHYNSSELFSGYKKGFIKDGVPIETACISLGNTLSESRFYFADKAVDSYIERELNTNPEEFISSFGAIIRDVNVALYSICELFIQKRGFGWREPKP